MVAASPEHPGGIHYLIHATDSPRFADRGLAAARQYDALAPDADHALHMPSHIFLQLGMWDEVAASNERAWAASRAWVSRGGHTIAELGWHSLQWLQYAYLQQGRYAQARTLIDSASGIVAGASPESLAGYPDAQYTLETMAFQYGMETGRWDAVARYAADPAAMATARAAGKLDQALAIVTPLVSGTRDAGVAPVGPPTSIPATELLGAISLDAKRPADAAAAIEQALAERPNRSAAVLALARARTAAADGRRAAEAYAKLLTNWTHADADLPALAEARAATAP